MNPLDRYQDPLFPEARRPHPNPLPTPRHPETERYSQMDHYGRLIADSWKKTSTPVMDATHRALGTTPEQYSGRYPENPQLSVIEGVSDHMKGAHPVTEWASRQIGSLSKKAGDPVNIMTARMTKGPKQVMATGGALEGVNYLSQDALRGNAYDPLDTTLGAAAATVGGGYGAKYGDKLKAFGGVPGEVFGRAGGSMAAGEALSGIIQGAAAAATPAVTNAFNVVRRFLPTPVANANAADNASR